VNLTAGIPIHVRSEFQALTRSRERQAGILQNFPAPRLVVKPRGGDDTPEKQD
jgi:hypothetical protein